MSLGVTDLIPLVMMSSPTPDLIDRFDQVARSFAWTRGATTQAGWYDWLDTLPLEHDFDFEDGTQALAVHASPGQDDFSGVHPGLSESELERLFDLDFGHFPKSIYYQITTTTYSTL